MAKDLMSGLSTLGTTRIKKRKIITIKLFDKNSMPTKNPALAYKTNITIQNDVASVDISRDYDKPKEYSAAEKKAISVFGYEADTEGIYKNYELSEDEDIASTIIPDLFKMTYLDLTINGFEDTVGISSNLMAAFFQKFSCININNKSISSITFPSGDIRLESLAISGGNIVLTDGISFEADDSISFESIKFHSKQDKTPFNLLCKKINLFNISTSDYIPIKIIAGKDATTNEYMNGEVSINDLTFDLTEITDNGYPEVKKDPLLSITNIYKVRLSDINIYGAQEYKAIKLHKINTVMISGINRYSDKGVYGYTLGLSDVMTTYVTNFHVSAGLLIEREVYAIFIADEGLGFNQKLVVSDFEIRNIRLINLGSSKADSISFSNGKINTNYFMESKETNDTSSLRFSDCDITISQPISIYGNEITFANTKLKLTDSAKDEHEHLMHIDGSLTLDNSVLYGEIPFKFEVGTGTYLKFLDSDVSLTKISIMYDEEAYKDIEDTQYVDESERVVDFESTNVVTDELLIDSMYNVSTDKTSFNISKLILKNTKASFDPLVVDKKSNVEYSFENTTFKNATIETRESHSSKLSFKESTGNLTFKVNELYIEEDSINLDTLLEQSKINLKVDTVGSQVNAMVNANDSEGSTVFGLNAYVSVIPSMKSKDIQSFNLINEFNDSIDTAVNYGNSSETPSPYEAFGLKV